MPGRGGTGRACLRLVAGCPAAGIRALRAGWRRCRKRRGPAGRKARRSRRSSRTGLRGSRLPAAARAGELSGQVRGFRAHAAQGTAVGCFRCAGRARCGPGLGAVGRGPDDPWRPATKKICVIPGDELTSAQWHRYIPILPYMATCRRWAPTPVAIRPATSMTFTRLAAPVTSVTAPGRTPKAATAASAAAVALPSMVRALTRTTSGRRARRPRRDGPSTAAPRSSSAPHQCRLRCPAACLGADGLPRWRPCATRRRPAGPALHRPGRCRTAVLASR
jgi:hypothetical protein